MNGVDTRFDVRMSKVDVEAYSAQAGRVGLPLSEVVRYLLAVWLSGEVVIPYSHIRRFRNHKAVEVSARMKRARAAVKRKT